jgi:hypothetical protein
MKNSCRGILFIATCSFLVVADQPGTITVGGLKQQYARTDSVKIEIKNNGNRKIYFHLEGDYYSKEQRWREFENNILTGAKSKSETNFYLTAGETQVRTIDPKVMMRKFKELPDSFRLRVVYYYPPEDGPYQSFSTSFILK